MDHGGLLFSERDHLDKIDWPLPPTAAPAAAFISLPDLGGLRDVATAIN
jgi:hypothetical protein